MIKIKKIPSIVRVIVLLLLSIFLSFAIISTTLFRDINNIFYDFWFTFRDFSRNINLPENNVMARAIDNNLNDKIVIIGIDEKTIQKFNTYPWSRMKYISFFEYLNKAAEQDKPSVVFLDILFVDKSDKRIEEEFYLKSPDERDKEVFESPDYLNIKNAIEKYQIDTPLGKAIESCGRVFLPSHFRSREKSGKNGQKTGMDYEREFEQYKEELALLKSFSIIAKKNSYLPEYQGIMPPIIDISAHARGIGFVTIEEGGIEILRQIPLFAQLDEDDGDIRDSNDSRYYPAIDLLIALKYFDVLLEDIKITWGSHVILKNALHPETGKRGDIIIPVDKEGNLRINYRAPHNTFPIRSFVDIVEQRIPLEYLAGKYLLVGITAAGAAHDFWISPLGGMYGIEHHANILNTLFTHDFLYTLPERGITGVILLFAFIAGFITYKQKFVISSIITISILILSFIISIIAFYYNMVFPFTYILFTVLVTFIIILIYKGFAGELEISGLFRDIQKQIEYNKQLNDDLAELVENTIHATIEQVSDIDGYTGLHNDVLGILGYEFQKCDNLIYFTKAESEILRLARLHDIGKININPNILRKSNRLSGSEYEEIKWHTIAGGRYLRRFNKPAFKDAARLAVGHQESWDGVNGYPRGTPNAVEDIEIRNGERIRWNFILDFMSVLDTFHAMTSNRPYRKGLAIEIVFRELVNNANTQFSSLTLEEFFAFFYTLYKSGVIRIVGNNNQDLSLHENCIYVNAHYPELMDEFITIHLRMMEFFNRSFQPEPDIDACSYDFRELMTKLKEYILIDNKNHGIQKIKNQLYTILLEKQEIKRIMTTYLDPKSRGRLREKLEILNQKQESLRENLFEKSKYKQLFIKKIMIEYYDIIINAPLGNKQSFYYEYLQTAKVKQYITQWYDKSLHSLDVIRELLEHKLGGVRYNNICRLLRTIGYTRHTPCYAGDIILYLYDQCTEDERQPYFEKIEFLRKFINEIQFPDSTVVVHRFISSFATALKKKIEDNNGDLLNQWDSLFTVLSTYRENMMLPIPAELKKILNYNMSPVQNYNVFTLVMELIGAYYIEKKADLEENWISLFTIMHKLNTLKSTIYIIVQKTMQENDPRGGLRDMKILYSDSFVSYLSKADFLTYLLQVEEIFLREKINTPFFTMMVKFLRLSIWKQVKKIEEAYTILKNIERKDYVSDFKGSIISMFKTRRNSVNPMDLNNSVESETAGDSGILRGAEIIPDHSPGTEEEMEKNDILDGVDVFQEAIGWVEEILEIMWA